VTTRAERERRVRYPTTTVRLPPIPDGVTIIDYLKEHKIPVDAIRRLDGQKALVVEYFTGRTPPDPLEGRALPRKIPAGARKALREWAKHYSRMVACHGSKEAVRSLASLAYESLREHERVLEGNVSRAMKHLVRAAGSATLAKLLIRDHLERAREAAP